MSKKTKMTVEKVEAKESNLEMYEAFGIVNNGANFVIVMGNQVIDKNTFGTAEEAKAYIDSKPWELIINATCYVYDMSKSVKNNKN